MQVEDGTAKVGRDFSHSSAGLVQFDPGEVLVGPRINEIFFEPNALISSLPVLGPGVNVKTWSIFLVDDGLEENHETFDVVLKTPRNAVLGQRTSARVEILDPRGGWKQEFHCLIEAEEPHEFHLCQDVVTQVI